MSPSAAGATLTDATGAVAVYLRAVRRRRRSGAERAPLPTHLEAAFVEAAAMFGRAHSIEFATWREAGVDPAVLRRAGISCRHRRR